MGVDSTRGRPVRPFRRWSRATRRERIGASHSYGFVLIFIGATFLLLIAAPEQPWAQSIAVLLECALLASALWATGLGVRGPGALLVPIGIVAALVELSDHGSTLTGLGWLLDVLLVGATVIVIGLGVIDQHEINRQAVSGAICIYLLLGIVFTFLFGAVAELQTANFFAQGTDGTTDTRVYFSYVTLATLGYGDYTPATGAGRSLAIGEALLGQLYLVTVVALLVGHFGQRRASRDSGEAREAA